MALSAGCSLEIATPARTGISKERKRHRRIALRLLIMYPTSDFCLSYPKLSQDDMRIIPAVRTTYRFDFFVPFPLVRVLLLGVNADTTIGTLCRTDGARLQGYEHVIIAGIDRDAVRVGIGDHVL